MTLLQSIKFVSQVSKSIGPPYLTHLTLSRHRATSFDGIVTLSAPIEEELDCCPHAESFLAALQACGDTFSITQLPTQRLSIKSGPFKRFVPCASPLDVVIPFTPDPIVADISQEFFTALKTIAPLATENSAHIATSSVLIQSGSALSTDRKLIIEYWHGLSLPKFVLTKHAASTIVATEKTPTKLGFTPEHSVTVYFDDDCWIKCQLASEEWPDLSRIWEPCTMPAPIPEGFWKAFETVSAASEDDAVRFTAEGMRSHWDDGLGASYDFPNLPEGIMLPVRRTTMLKAFDKADLRGVNDISYFYGPKMRAALAQVR